MALGSTLSRQLEGAGSANFYKSAAQLCEAFLTLEQVRFSVNTKSSKHKIKKIDVKNVTDCSIEQYAIISIEGMKPQKDLPQGKEAMMKDNKEIDTSREDLLKGLTTATVAGAVVMEQLMAAASETVEMPEKDVKKTGYA